MGVVLVETSKVSQAIEGLGSRDPKKHKKIVRCLAKLAADPFHPGLASHGYDMIKGPAGERIWESYVENGTASPWRVWWFYRPNSGEITVVDIGPHP